MVKAKKTKRTRILVWIMIPLIIVIGILAYYQLFYKSPRIEDGPARLAKTFTNHRHIVTAVRFAPNDSLLITSSVDSTVRIHNIYSGVIVKELKQTGGISYMDLSIDGNNVLTGSYDSIVRLWDLNDARIIRAFKGHKGTIWTVAFSPDGKKIASSGDDAMINVWDAESGKLIQQLKGHERIVWSIKFSPDGMTLASGSFDFTLKVWNISDGKLIWDNREHTETVVDVAFSHSGNLLASTSDDKTIRIWNLDEQKLVRLMKVAEHVQAVAFSPDDKRLLTGGRDKPMIGEFLQTIFGDSKFNPGVSSRLWDIGTGALLQTFTQHGNDVMDVAYSHNGKWLATASADKTVALWQISW